MVFIVAECGVNFSNLVEARELIKLSKWAGADAVKFQVFNHDTLVQVWGGDVERHPEYDNLMKIMLGHEELSALKDCADKYDIEMFATPMFTDAVIWLEDIGVKRYKVRYKDRHNGPLLKKIINTGKRIIISCDWDYVADIPKILIHGIGQVSFLLCIPEYPPAKLILPHRFGIKFDGFSNHYPSIIPPLAAVCRGAEIIEVHVKLPNTDPIDSNVSITTYELSELVKMVRGYERWSCD